MKVQKAIRLVSSMAVSSIAAIFVGNWLDEQFSTGPWILLMLLLYAIGGTLYMIVKGFSD